MYSGKRRTYPAPRQKRRTLVALLIPVVLSSQIPVEFTQTVSRSAATPAEWRGQVGVERESSCGLEWASGQGRGVVAPVGISNALRRDGSAPAEWGLIASRYVALPVSYDQTVRSDGGGPVEWTGAIPDRLTTAPLEILQRIAKAGSLSVEWVGDELQALAIQFDVGDVLHAPLMIDFDVEPLEPGEMTPLTIQFDVLDRLATLRIDFAVLDAKLEEAYSGASSDIQRPVVQVT